jgi:hypothetical protein
MSFQPSPSINAASRTRQTSVSDPSPLALTVAPRYTDAHLRARTRAILGQWNGESPWRALNRCIARYELIRPTHSWIAQQRNYWRH